MASDVVALIPARAGSKGIPNKNFRLLNGLSPTERALMCAWQVEDCQHIVLSTDSEEAAYRARVAAITGSWAVTEILRPDPPIHSDDCPMIDVVKDALQRVPGPPEQIILLVQPTQPLRQPKHLRAAIELLESSGADSVVSVVELPETHKPPFACFITREQPPALLRYFGSWDDVPVRRQDEAPAYIRDGTVYAFRRATVAAYGNIYGQDVRPLIIPPDETCPLDTPVDWLEAERRLHALSDVSQS